MWNEDTNSKYSLINNYTRVLFCFICICKQVHVFTNKKKPLSAQAIGTDMYKNGGVNQIKPATEQPEWSTKSLEYYGGTEKDTPYIRNVTDWDRQLLICGSVPDGQELNLFRHRESDFSSCDTELRFCSCKSSQKKDQIFLPEG